MDPRRVSLRTASSNGISDPFTAGRSIDSAPAARHTLRPKPSASPIAARSRSSTHPAFLSHTPGFSQPYSRLFSATSAHLCDHCVLRFSGLVSLRPIYMDPRRVSLRTASSNGISDPFTAGRSIDSAPAARHTLRPKPSASPIAARSRSSTHPAFLSHTPGFSQPYSRLFSATSAHLCDHCVLRFSGLFRFAPFTWTLGEFRCGQPPPTEFPTRSPPVALSTPPQLLGTHSARNPPPLP